MSSNATASRRQEFDRLDPPAQGPANDDRPRIESAPEVRPLNIDGTFAPSAPANDLGEKPPTFPMGPEEMTLRMLTKEYFARKVSAEATRSRDRPYAKELYKYFIPEGRADVSLAEITEAKQKEVRELRARQPGRRGEFMSELALRDLEDFFGKMIRFVVDEGLLTYAIPVYRGARSRWDSPLIDEETMFLLRVEARGKRNVSLALDLEHFAGCDFEEARRLKWPAVDFSAGALTPPTAVNKKRTYDRPAIRMARPLRQNLERAYKDHRTEWVLEHQLRPIKSLKDAFTPIRHRVMERYRRRLPTVKDEEARKVLADRIAALDVANINTLRSSIPTALLGRGCVPTHVAAFIDLRWEDFVKRYESSIPNNLLDTALQALNNFKV